MSFTIHRTAAPVGAVITGLELNGLSRGEEGALYQAFLDYGVLVFKGMDVDNDGQLALSNIFGEPQIHPIEYIRLKDQPYLVDFVSNKGVPVAEDDPDLDSLTGVLRWHVDGLYTDSPPRGGLLRAMELPAEGGDTGWIDTASVYRALPYSVKCRIQGLRVLNSYAHTGNNAQAFPEVVYPLVCLHPEIDVPMLCISPSSTVRILGLPEDEGRELLQYLIERLTQEDLAYRHQWEVGDMALWDNWRTMHRTYGHLKRHRRVMRRTSLKAQMRLGQCVGGQVSMEAVD